MSLKPSWAAANKQIFKTLFFFFISFLHRWLPVCCPPAHTLFQSFKNHSTSRCSTSRWASRLAAVKSTRCLVASEDPVWIWKLCLQQQLGHLLFFCLLLLICYYFSCQQRSTSIHMWLHSVTVRGYWIGNTQSEKKYRTVQGCVGLFLLPQTAEGVNTDWAAGQTQTLLQTANRIASSIDFNWLPLQKVARLTGLNTLRYISQFFHH